MMDEAQLLQQLQEMDASALESFVISLRSNAVMKMALRTIGKAKGIGSMVDILLDEAVPPSSLVAFFTIAQMPESDRGDAVRLWMSNHPDLAPRIIAAMPSSM